LKIFENKQTTQDNTFPGLLNFVYAYLDTLDMEEEARRKIERYLDLVRYRSNGGFDLLTQHAKAYECK
jgi:hypothetical protein